MTPGAIAPSKSVPTGKLSDAAPAATLKGRIEAEFGREADKLERIARFLRGKNAPKFLYLI
jgi:hypothetical protein